MERSGIQATTTCDAELIGGEIGIYRRTAVTLKRAGCPFHSRFPSQENSHDTYRGSPFVNDRHPHSPSLSYRDAGVDIAAGNRLVDRIKPHAKRRTVRPGVLGGLGGFGALFELPLDRYRQPVLVSGTDGVGTKLKLALELRRHDTIGIDLVAMCVNDVLVVGPNRCSFWTITPPARSTWRWRRT
jgi:hypothetical protein